MGDTQQTVATTAAAEPQPKLELTPEMRKQGQIRCDTRFGLKLIELARQAETMVEIGLLGGAGSTWCLYCGLERPTQRIWSVELLPELVERARKFYSIEPRMTFIHGTLVLPGEVPPYASPVPEMEPYYEVEVRINEAAPYALPLLPDRIDLLLIDGGEWSAGPELAKLWQRSRIIALDDVNPILSWKNAANALFLTEKRWKVIASDISERAGWAIYQRP